MIILEWLNVHCGINSTVKPFRANKLYFSQSGEKAKPIVFAASAVGAGCMFLHRLLIRSLVYSYVL